MLLRYFTALRKRLQSSMGGVDEGLCFDEVEPEPEDINPAREAEGSDDDAGDAEDGGAAMVLGRGCRLGQCC